MTGIALRHGAAKRWSKQRHRRTDGRGLGVRGELDRYRHHATVARDVEQLLAIASPACLCATVRGDDPLVAWARERLNVDLGATGLVGLVGDPVAVWRELPALFGKRSLDHGEGRVLAIQRPRPDVGASRGILDVEEHEARVG